MSFSAVQSADRQARVIFALILREMITRYGRSPLGFAWAVIEPAAFVALLSILFIQIAHSPPVGRSFPLFYATGYVAFHLFHDVSSVVSRSVHVNRTLLAFPAINPLDTVIARFLLQTISGFAVATVIIGAILVVFDDPVFLDARPLVLGFLLAIALGLGVGVVNCWLFAISRSWELVWGVISRPLFLISCVFFSFESMPGFVREILWFNPLVHLVGLLRQGVYPIYDAAHVSPVYVLGIALFLTATGLIAIRWSAARLGVP